MLDLGDLGAQAAKLRAAAEANARRIIADAEQRAAELVQGADAKGHEQGLAAGREQGLAQGREQGHAEALAQCAEQLQQLQTAWSQLAEQWDQQRTAMQREARRAVLDFATHFAELVVHRVVEVDQSVIVDQVANALSLVLRPQDVTIRINPTDRPLLGEAMPQLLSAFPGFEHIHLADDESVSRGGCVLSYGQGEIDAQLDTQVKRILELIAPRDERSPDTTPTEPPPPSPDDAPPNERRGASDNDR